MCVSVHILQYMCDCTCIITNLSVLQYIQLHFHFQDIKKKISKCKDEKSIILDLSKCDVSDYVVSNKCLVYSI